MELAAEPHSLDRRIAITALGIPDSGLGHRGLRNFLDRTRTLRLALFGPERFPRLMGKLAFPSLIVQALAPSAGALMIEMIGSDAIIGVLTLLALTNVVLIGALW